MTASPIYSTPETGAKDIGEHGFLSALGAVRSNLVWQCWQLGSRLHPLALLASRPGQLSLGDLMVKLYNALEGSPRKRIPAD